MRAELARAAAGEAFLLLGGDCAESFAEFHANAVRDTLKVLLQMAVVLSYAAGAPVVKVARMAGQFAKPRSSMTETIGATDAAVLLRRHHQRHRVRPRRRGRRIPARMLRGYNQAAITLNLLRAFTQGGFADLHRVQQWNQAFVAASPQGERYAEIGAAHRGIAGFMTACGI